MQDLPSHDPGIAPLPKVLSRDQAIRALRHYLVKLTDEDTSICQVASRKGIFCGGFQQWTDAQFREKYSILVAKRPGLTRRQLEYLANTWQLARQIVDNVSLSCDAQSKEHDTCNGWDSFTDDDLRRFCKEILGAEVTIQPEAAAPAIPAHP
jgi:hypothetical protein